MDRRINVKRLLGLRSGQILAKRAHLPGSRRPRPAGARGEGMRLIGLAPGNTTTPGRQSTGQTPRHSPVTGPHRRIYCICQEATIVGRRVSAATTTRWLLSQVTIGTAVAAEALTGHRIT